MSEFKITLKPVYSCPVLDNHQDVKMPENWTLAWHQVETLKAVRNPKIDVIFNTAMTGDGKSLAAYLNILQGDSTVLGLYPTNELARDQETQTRRYIEIFHTDHRVNRVSGEELEIYAEKERVKKADALETRAEQSEILLANPDIFHYLHRGAYLIRYDNPDKLWNRIDKQFDLFVFDEFHVFQAPQIASVINTMLLIRHTNRRKKFLFLSATPNLQLIERLTLAGFDCELINPLSENKYRFPETKEECQELENQGWRQVSREIGLHFISLEPSSQASETWLKENQELIAKQFQQYPGSKGAIILNSIAAVKRLKPILQERLRRDGLVVEENTGLSGREEKRRSLAADLILGTSTIDVGVDFKINFLIFESADAGNFIQRLGRLGRHDGYEREGKWIDFTQFTAYALVPNFLVGKLFLEENAPLKLGEKCDNATRPYFHDIIRENYRQINNFDGYYSKWGIVQSLRLFHQLGHPKIKQAYQQGSQQAFRKDCERAFKTPSLKKVYARSNDWEKEWQQISGGKKGNPILEEAASFRGSSPLQCGLYDTTEENEADKFKTYDLPGIISNLEIEPMSEAAFMRLLEATKTRTNTFIPKGRFRYCLGFMKLHGYREERLNWKFTYPGDLKPIGNAGKVQMILGIQVWQPENYWIGEINKQLKKLALVCYVLRHPVTEVRRRLQLPMHFQIYPISDQSSIHDGAAPYSIAFGQSALLVDTLAHRLNGKGDEVWIV